MSNQIKSKEDCKDAVAKDRGYPSWDDYYNWIARDGQFPAVVAQLIESATQDAIDLYHSQFRHDQFTPSNVDEKEINDKLDKIFKECTISLSGPDNGQMVLSVPRAKVMVSELFSSYQSSISSPVCGQWIKIEDGLPEVPPSYVEDEIKITPLSMRVIVYDGQDVYEDDYYKEDGFKDETITHWMPLPNKPGESSPCLCARYKEALEKLLYHAGKAEDEQFSDKRELSKRISEIIFLITEVLK